MSQEPRTDRPGPTDRPAPPGGAPSRRRWGPWAALLAAVGPLGCATLGGDPGQSLVPSRYETRTGPFAVYTGVPIAPDGPTIRNLQSLERDLTSTLSLRVPPEQTPIEVYVLRDREAFTHFLTIYYPELPPRRAFFLAQGPRRVVYTFHNDRLDEDLRHEAAHALLNAAVGDLPLWLDEGLAEYFEGPEGRQGLNPEHLARLPDDLKGGWRPDLARLERLKNVREMSPRDYREAWAWVHYLLNEPGAGKADLLAYLGDLHAGAAAGEAPPPLSDRLARSGPGSGQAMLTHLDRVRTAPPKAPVAAKPNPAEPTVLLQDSALDPSARTPQRRSLLQRFLGLFSSSGRSS
jgi:hypothetical protein